MGQGAVGARMPSARGTPASADGGRGRGGREQGHARLQRQDRRQDDLGVPVRVRGQARPASVIARSVSDEAIHGAYGPYVHGLLRYARNDKAPWTSTHACYAGGQTGSNFGTRWSAVP